MKVAIIGGGFTGLSCALELLKVGIEVDVYEEGNGLGGLAGVFQPKRWLWSLEYFYHHVFINDKEIIDLAKKMGWPVKILSPITTSFIDGQEIQLDSPLSVLKFSKMSFWGRLRMGLGLLVLKALPDGLFLERYRVVDFLPRLIGKEGYEVIWSKLLKAKFGKYEERVNMAWFWTRVTKRTKKLGYFEGGFGKLTEKILEKIVKMGGKIEKKIKIQKIRHTKDTWEVEGKKYEAVVLTVPAPVANKITDSEIDFPKIDYLWGQALVLELKNSLIKGYWMNILEKEWPFLVVVEQTKMVDKENYDGKQVVYLGNYLDEENKQLAMSDKELIDMYEPFLKKINKGFSKKWILRSFLFRKPNSQPVFPINYARLIPKMRGKMKGLYLANMSMVYPFDRGVDRAVKMGREVAKILVKDLK